MNPISRAVRGIVATAFSADSTTVFTVDRYVSAWRVPTLERIYRVRPLPELVRLALQPGGDLLLSSHRHGRFGLLDSRTGALIATCGGDTSADIVHFGLSTCGKFVIHSRWRDLIVREIASNRVVWQREGRFGPVLPFNGGAEWAVFNGRTLELWPWPFGAAPRQIIELPGSLYFSPAISGNLLALDGYGEIQVLDLDTGHERYSAKCGNSAKPYLLSEGSLLTAGDGRLDLYDRHGSLHATVVAPSLHCHSHAASPIRDDVVLTYQHGLMLIRDAIHHLQGTSEVPAPGQPREQRFGRHPDRSYRSQIPSEQITIEADSPEALTASLQRFQRPCWKPILRDERGPIDGSKFGGVAWLGAGEEWPCCGQCGGPMDLFLQLNSKELPEHCPRSFDGLLQVFVCSYETYAGGLCQSSEAFSNAAYVRVVAPTGAPSCLEAPSDELFDEQHIVGWTRHNDMPHFTELEQHGITLSDEQQTLQIDGDWAYPVAGDKLLGWADWMQGVQLVACPECGQAMSILFQIESCHGIPAMLADGGRGWVSQCSQHREVVCFSWTCG